jgi:hypothetical protein
MDFDSCKKQWIFPGDASYAKKYICEGNPDRFG